MSWTKRILIILILVLLVVGGIALHKKRTEQLKAVPPAEQTPLALHVAPVQQGMAVQTFLALGRIESGQSLKVAAQLGGRIEKMGPREGAKVNAGEVLAQLDVSELKANRDALRAKRQAVAADLAHARAELKREQALLQSGGSTRSAVDKWKTQVQALEGQLASLKAQIEALNVKIGYGTVRAPVDATIAQRLAEPGDTTAPGKPLYVLNTAAGGRVVIPLPLTALQKVKPGTGVILRNGDAEMRAKITRVRPSLNAQSLGEVYVDLPQRPFGLPVNAPLEARVIMGEAQGFVVPHNALFKRESNRATLIAVKNGKADLIPVEIVLDGDHAVVVKGDGLADVQQVVVGHPSVIYHVKAGDVIVVAQEG